MDEILKENLEKEYEISFLIREENHKEEILSALQKIGAELIFVKEPEKINLAYPIKHVNQALFGFIDFKAFPEKAKELENNLKTSKNILRFMIIYDSFIKKPSQDKKKIEESKKPKQFIKQQENVLTNEALEKKLEEMLQ